MKNHSCWSNGELTYTILVTDFVKNKTERKDKETEITSRYRMLYSRSTICILSWKPDLMLNYVLLFTVKKSTVYIKKTNNAKSPFHAGLLVLAFVSVETRTKKKKKKKKKKKNQNVSFYHASQNGKKQGHQVFVICTKYYQ